MDDNGDLVFQQGDRNNLMSSSSGMYTNIQDEKVLEEKTMNTMSMLKSSSGEDSLFFHTGWDPLVSMVQNLEFKGSSLDSHHQISPSSLNVGILEDPRMNDSSHSIQYPADPRHGEIEPKVSCFGNGSFSEMLSPFCLPESNQTRNAGSLPPRTITDPGVIFREDLPIRNGDYRRTVLNGKKRKGPPELHETHSQFDSVQSIETEQRRDGPGEAIEGLKGLDERKKRNKQTPSSNFCGKLTSKQTKDSSQTEDPPKEDYVHVRARRGQATNSHSLAERVRREKISERMRLLQDLVPGCDKITGKALMLDEIINYVQSLQRQVEFLSMKLATVNPELTIDIERILSKDILHSHGGGGLPIHGFHPEMNSSHSQFHLYPRETIQTIQNTELHSLPMPQITKSWDDDLHSVVQTGFVSNPALNDIGLNGCTKVQI